MKITKSELKKLIKEVYDEHIENYSPEMSADETQPQDRFFDVIDRDSGRFELEDAQMNQFYRWLDENPEYSETTPPEDYTDKSNNVLWVTTQPDPYTITDDLPQGLEDEAEMQNSRDAIAANERPGKMTFEEWLADETKSDDYDDWLSHAQPERYGNVNESFQFDKFMKNIGTREEKIAQHKKELTESEDVNNKRTLQKLYQEDWRNSVSYNGKK